MKRIKKLVRLIVFICLILLAGIGVGMSGGVPIPSIKSKRDPNKAKTELVEEQDQNSSSELN